MTDVKTYRPDIDGLRAVAVSGVLLFHAFPQAFPSGFLGVDVFFVISGYLISGILMRALTSERFSLKEFYIARIKRIFPSLLLVLSVVALVGWFYLLPEEFSQLGRHIAGGGAFVGNILYWNESGYFDVEAARKPLLHLWSLGVEEQFYIVFPLVLFVVYRWDRRLSTVMWVVAVLAILLAAIAHRGDAVAQFYSPLSRAWQLCCGVLLALWELRLRRQDGAAGAVAAKRVSLSLWGLLLIFIALVGTRDIPWLDSWPGLLPVIGAVLVVADGPLGWGNRSLLASPTAVWLGRISYPVYLWHWPMFAIAHILIGRHPDAWLGCILLAASVLLGWASAKWVEGPLRHGKSRQVAPALLMLMVCMVFLGWSINQRAGFPTRAVPKGQLAELEYGLHWQGWENCDAIKTNSVMGGCKRIHSGQDVEVAVIGDSHAGHLASGLHDQYKKRQVGVAVMLHAGCFPYRPLNISGQSFFDCPDDAIVQALDYAERNTTVKVVVLAGYAALQVHGNRFHEATWNDSVKRAARIQALNLGFKQTVRRLLDAGKKVIFVIDNPELLVDPKACVERAFPFGHPDCSIDVSAEQTHIRNQDLDALFVQHKVDFPQVQFFSARSIFCDDVVCRARKGRELWFASRDHLTPAGSRRVAVGLSAVIDASLLAH